jgi:hypothetical protein
MPRHNHKGRSRRAEPFVMLPRYLLESAAWRSLSAQARTLYIHLALRYNGRNNGALALSVRDAATECRLAKDTAARAFSELVERGFIELAQAGAFTFKTRHAAEWRLTALPCDRTGAPASKVFMRWRPPDPPRSESRSQKRDAPVPQSGTVTPFPRRTAC